MAEARMWSGKFEQLLGDPKGRTEPGHHPRSIRQPSDISSLLRVVTGLKP